MTPSQHGGCIPQQHCGLLPTNGFIDKNERKNQGLDEAIFPGADEPQLSNLPQPGRDTVLYAQKGQALSSSQDRVLLSAIPEVKQARLKCSKPRNSYSQSMCPFS